MNLKETRLRAWHFNALENVLMCCAVSVLLLTGANTAHAKSRPAFVVHSDRGGLLAQRTREIRRFRASGQRVELRGTCLSACTMYLGLSGTCVARTATLGFHGPSKKGHRMTIKEFDHWSLVMAKNYREPLRSWFMTEARYRTSGYHRISGAELIRLGYKQC